MGLPRAQGMMLIDYFGVSDISTLNNTRWILVGARGPVSYGGPNTAAAGA